jgi:hypothetical protein
MAASTRKLRNGTDTRPAGISAASRKRGLGKGA